VTSHRITVPSSAACDILAAAGDAKAAKNIFLGGILAACCLQAAIVMGVLSVGSKIVTLFCSDANVIASCVTVLPLLSVLMFFDGINSVASGVLRGAGRQALGAGVNFLGYWVVGVPLAAALAFTAGLGVQGFWLGVGSGAVLQAVVVMVLVSRWEWQVEVERVRAAIAASGGKAIVSYGH
jgi:MATE family multidrug resistance protein